ncbi:MAG: Pseudogene of conserved hypothetical protein [Methanobrevibacter sp. CfCl-M3]
MLNLETRTIRNITPSNSIQAAIDNASAGDIISLDGGVYNQQDINVTKKNLTIKASGIGGAPIIDGQGQGRGFNVTGAGVTIQDLTITNTKASGGGSNIGGGGVYMNGGGSSVVFNRFVNNTDSAMVGNGVKYTGSCNAVNLRFV